MRHLAPDEAVMASIGDLVMGPRFGLKDRGTSLINQIYSLLDSEQFSIVCTYVVILNILQHNNYRSCIDTAQQNFNYQIFGVKNSTISHISKDFFCRLVFIPNHFSILVYDVNSRGTEKISSRIIRLNLQDIGNFVTRHRFQIERKIFQPSVQLKEKCIQEAVTRNDKVQLSISNCYAE